MRHISVVVLCVLLAGCFSTAKSAPQMVQMPDHEAAMSAMPVSLPSPRLKPFPPTDEFLQCVPYARAVSGIEIYGDAWTWWDQAGEKYSRGSTPQIGSVLALKKTKNLSYGHVAVVASVQDSRNIMVNHANWGSDSRTRGKMHLRQPVRDVSPHNDWSQVQMMNTVGTFGRSYPAHGFIYQQHQTAEAN
ncbi:CHAP domain-containing protein [Thalassospira sp.]|uniref:CHAP domain-containing protein n=1 Tax=Thalassospira sp. TaxID=1912094 RepID=UPI002735B64A|nr:CHAP domain-containing protein [Thalassospira sp.]MDP2699373.1 CHAP domain-containing protein [Thalassospira sp.]